MIISILLDKDKYILSRKRKRSKISEFDCLIFFWELGQVIQMRIA